MTFSTEKPVPLKLSDVVDEIYVVRRLIRAAEMAAESDNVPDDCGLDTFLDVIHQKLTAACDKLEAVCHQDREPANV